MIVEINNEKVNLPENITIKQLLEQLNYVGVVAIWVNGQQLLQRDYSTWLIQEGDKIRVIRTLGGG
jgi:thiamine biosynthesis protein ThiS